MSKQDRIGVALLRGRDDLLKRHRPEFRIQQMRSMTGIEQRTGQ
jgi:hypothetical protein